jgi:hypothetical protein
MNVALGLSDGFDLNMWKTSFSDFCKYYSQVDSLESINMIVTYTDIDRHIYG